MNFSVLMSLYYKEKVEYFNLAMESVYNIQSVKPSQIVLVLDGALGKDLNKAVQIWKNKLNEILYIVTLKENMGLAKALNEGLKYCSYTWVFRMDTDDICMPRRFEIQIDYIKNNPKVTVLGGQIAEFSISDTESKFIKLVPKKYKDILKFYQNRNPFNHMTVAFNKEVIHSVGGYHSHIFMEDYNLWVRVIKAGFLVENLSQILVLVRTGCGLHSRRRGLKYIQSEWQLFNLKKTLNVQNSAKAFMLLLVRSSFRVLPARILKIYYQQFLRAEEKQKK